MQESEHHQEEILVSEQVEVEENPPSREVQDTMSDKHNPQPRQMRQHQQNSRRSNNTGGASSGSNQRRQGGRDRDHRDHRDRDYNHHQNSSSHNQSRNRKQQDGYGNIPPRDNQNRMLRNKGGIVERIHRDRVDNLVSNYVYNDQVPHQFDDRG